MKNGCDVYCLKYNQRLRKIYDFLVSLPSIYLEWYIPVAARRHICVWDWNFQDFRLSDWCLSPDVNESTNQRRPRERNFLVVFFLLLPFLANPTILFLLWHDCQHGGQSYGSCEVGGKFWWWHRGSGRQWRCVMDIGRLGDLWWINRVISSTQSGIMI